MATFAQKTHVPVAPGMSRFAVTEVTLDDKSADGVDVKSADLGFPSVDFAIAVLKNSNDSVKSVFFDAAESKLVFDTTKDADLTDVVVLIFAVGK